MGKIYVASSWRNVYYPKVVTKLREAGHEVEYNLNLTQTMYPRYISLHLSLMEDPGSQMNFPYG